MSRQPMLGGSGFAVSRDLNPNLARVASLQPLGRETRKQPARTDPQEVASETIRYCRRDCRPFRPPGVVPLQGPPFSQNTKEPPTIADKRLQCS